MVDPAKRQSVGREGLAGETTIAGGEDLVDAVRAGTTPRSSIWFILLILAFFALSSSVMFLQSLKDQDGAPQRKETGVNLRCFENSKKI